MFHFWVLFLGQTIMTVSLTVTVTLVHCTTKRSHRPAGSEPNSDGRCSDPGATPCQPSGVLGQAIPPPVTATASTPHASTPAAPAPAPVPPKPVQPPSTGNDSKPDVVQIVIVDHIQKSPKAGNKDMPDTDKCAASPKQNNSMKETRTSAKDTRSTKEQGTGVNRTDGSSRPRKFEPRNEAERKQLEDIKKGKFGNTIDDDTLNDADHEWGEGDVIYKADRTKKKKKRR
uniref:Secreted protein n=1 Tax=Panagrellus redivivus TaxID=6233 RepID=A0A7E4ZXY0_PANRE